MKKIICLVGLFFLLAVSFSATFAGNLKVEPSRLNPNISSGRLDVNELSITNDGGVSLSVESDFDPKWMWLVPDKFDLSPGIMKNVTAIFFIPRGEEPKREGEIVFKSNGEQAKVKVKVVISTPVEEVEDGKKEKEDKTSAESSRERELKLLKQIESLQQEVHEKEIQEKSRPAKKDLTPIFDLLAKNLAEEIKKGVVLLSWIDGDILITIPGRIIFNAGQSYPKEEGLAVLFKVGSILRNKNESMKIEGHADSSPISSQKFPSNWELASTRSATAARILEYKTGINGRRLVASGYSSNVPISDNQTVDGRTKNRRLEIRISE